KRLSDESKKHVLKNLEMYPYFQQYASKLYNEQFDIFFSAPCLLLIYGDSNPQWNVYDCTLVAGNIMQDAMKYNLHTRWIGFAEHICETDEIKSKYKIPRHYKLVCALSVGYPKEQLLPLSRKPAKVIFRINDLRLNSSSHIV
ncbi:MAG TPA: nitroreductase family protein, partial [Desulfosporosinus sp.]|nr:nitroreductase family protein [Desulfosporosinus sp.]